MGLFGLFTFKKTKKRKIKLGLALSGGGARGYAHIGAIRAFEKSGIEFDYIAGTSAGSLVGAFYAAGFTSNKMEEVASTIKTGEIKSSKLFFMPSKTEGIEAIITKNLGDIVFSDLKKPFCAVAVNMKTGQEVDITSGSLAKAVAGSCAVPGFFNPVNYNDMLLSDGGLTNTIPSNIPKLFGCDYVVAVDVNKGRGYGTESTKILDIMSASIRIMMKINAQIGINSADVLIQPNLEKFKSTKLIGTDEMIQEGYRAAMQAVPEIKKLLGLDDDKAKHKKEKHAKREKKIKTKKVPMKERREIARLKKEQKKSDKVNKNVIQ